jgi:hypothetical protein
MTDSLLDVARQPFLDLASDIHGSLVYLDAGAAEVAELTLGPAFLLGVSNHFIAPSGVGTACVLVQS